jgi:hypothetical protein
MRQYKNQKGEKKKQPKTPRPSFFFFKNEELKVDV